MRRSFRTGASALLLSACALTACAAPRAEPPPVLEPVPAEALPPEPIFLRDALQPVPVSDTFAAAVRRGTRTLRGTPGERYWQQRVDYVIDAELDPQTATIQALETVTYHNNSPDTLRQLVLHLYQNAFIGRGEGGIRLERVVAGGAPARRVLKGTEPPRGASYTVDGTLMTLRLPRPVRPGGRTTLEIAWRFRVPAAPAPRMGHSRHQLYNVAQWYPQVAVYDDLVGWAAPQYETTGEFYLEYGNFDVSITVPEGWLVAAGGTLENAAEVLSDAPLERLRRARASDEVMRIVTADDHEAGAATQQSPGGQLTWRFAARDVRDFAFATAQRYLWDAARVDLPDADGDGEQEAVLAHAFYRETTQSWREVAEQMRHALRLNARWFGPYPYPQLSAAEGPVDGMEYPMLIFVRGFAQPYVLYGTIAHEVTHQWFPMRVGSNEAAFAWQDEGLATYAENLAVRDFLPETDPADESLGTYLGIAGRRLEEPLMRHSSAYDQYLAYAVASYMKAGTMLRVLGEVIGRDTLHAALRAYADAWANRHPHALDFFHAIEAYTGRDLDWFWYPWWYTTATADQAIARVVTTPAGAGERVRITIEDQGEAPLPVRLAITTVSGATRSVVVPVDVWLRGVRRHIETVELPERVARIEIDPERVMPDTDRADNLWKREGI